VRLECSYGRQIVSVGLCCLGLSFVGCGGDEAQARVIEDPIAEGLLPADWPGIELGVAPPEFVDEGTVTIAPEDSPAPRPEIVPSDGKFVHVPETELDVVHFGKQHTYHVTLAEGIERVAAARDARLAGLQASGAAVIPARLDKSVIGDDDRVPMGIAQGYSPDSWLSAIGLLGTMQEGAGGCTAIMIAPNAFLTAAHCAFTKEGNPISRYVMPRYDPSAGDLARKAPWGIYTAAELITPRAYKKNNCHIGSFRTECAQYDIAFVPASQPNENAPPNPWFFRFKVETRAQLDTRELRNVGYPSCTETGHPEPCLPAQLYGSVRTCALGLSVPSGDDEAPTIHHDCDTSSGHSGGPIFYYDAQGRPILIGLHVASNPLEDSVRPNIMKHFSQNTLNWIHGLL